MSDDIKREAEWLRKAAGVGCVEYCPGCGKKVTAAITDFAGDKFAAIADRLESLEADNQRLQRIEAAAKEIVVAHDRHALVYYSTGCGCAHCQPLRAALAQPERDATPEECERMEGG